MQEERTSTKKREVLAGWKAWAEGARAVRQEKAEMLQLCFCAWKVEGKLGRLG